LPEAALVGSMPRSCHEGSRSAVRSGLRARMPGFLDETHGHLHSKRGGHGSTLAMPARLSTRRAAACLLSACIVFDCARFGRALIVAACARSIASSALVTC
jgi:hypothetical protein